MHTTVESAYDDPAEMLDSSGPLGRARSLSRSAFSLLSLCSVAFASACSLISLDALQDGDAASTGADSSSSGHGGAGSSAAQGPVASSSHGSSVSVAQSVATVGSGSCGGFCDGQTTPTACADFDGSPHQIGDAWVPYLDYDAPNVASIGSDASDYVTCAASAKIELQVNGSGTHSTIQLRRDVPATGWHMLHLGGDVRRSGPGGVAPEGASVLEIDWAVDDTHYCQSYLQLFDDPGAPRGYFFAQLLDVSSGGTTVWLGDTSIPLDDPTNDTWVHLSVTLDWSTTPPMAHIGVGSAESSMEIPGDCGVLPSQTLTAGWGLTYDSQSQTNHVDNLTSDIE